MIDYVGALEKANVYYDATRQGVKFDKSEAVRELAAFGLFTPHEVARIINKSHGFVVSHWGWHTNESWPQREWNLNTLDALAFVAREWQAKRYWEMHIPNIARAGTSVKAISQLTGVPIEEVRRLVW